MAGKISVQVVICLKALQSFATDISSDISDKQSISEVWQDVLARFRIWSSNIGAHQKGQASLDYRLRDASHIKDQIIRVLGSLRQNLLDAEEVLVEMKYDEPNEDSATELEEIYVGIQKLIDCLFQLSMRIRRPAQRDKLIGRRKEDSKDFDDFDRRHVRDKFPRASDILVERLTAAISTRRSNLSYFERHRRKLGKGIALESEGGDSRTAYSSTLATTFQEHKHVIAETVSISHASETSYAPSLFTGDSRITIPAAPEESANNKPFECPYCFLIITISNGREWAKHVFQDLEPYVCISEDCSMPGRLYNNKREWVAHLRKYHVQSLQSTKCSLCGEMHLTDLQIQQHLRRHLEDLALYILPPSTSVEDELSSEESIDEMEIEPQIPQVSENDLTNETQILSKEQESSHATRNESEEQADLDEDQLQEISKLRETIKERAALDQSIWGAQSRTTNFAFEPISLPASREDSPSGTNSTSARINTTEPEETFLYSGGPIENVIRKIEAMGFSRNEIQPALRAASFDTDRTIEYLLNGIPDTQVEQRQVPQQLQRQQTRDAARFPSQNIAIPNDENEDLESSRPRRFIPDFRVPGPAPRFLVRSESPVSNEAQRQTARDDIVTEQRQKDGGLRRLGAWMGLRKPKSKGGPDTSLSDTTTSRSVTQEPVPISKPFDFAHVTHKKDTGVTLLRAHSAYDLPNNVAEQEQSDSEPEADTIQVGWRFSNVHLPNETKGEYDRVVATRDRQFEPLDENEIVEWDGLRRRKTLIDDPIAAENSRRRRRIERVEDWYGGAQSPINKVDDWDGMISSQRTGIDGRPVSSPKKVESDSVSHVYGLPEDLRQSDRARNIHSNTFEEEMARDPPSLPSSKRKGTGAAAKERVSTADKQGSAPNTYVYPRAPDGLSEADAENPNVFDWDLSE